MSYGLSITAEICDCREMETLEAVRTEALKLARRQLGQEVKDVVVTEDTDLDGKPSLRVTIILKSQWSADPPGAKLGRISVDLADYLARTGDKRFPFTHYVTFREFRAASREDDRRTATARRRKAAR